MRISSFALGSIIFTLAACGAGEEKPAAAPGAGTALAPPSSSSSATTPPALVETTPAPAVVAEPTALTDDQKKRDLALAPKAAAIVDAFSNDAPHLSRDGKRVVFRSNRDGQWQAYVADATKPAAPPTKLTQSTERVSSVMFTPDDKSVLFRSDEGADENFRIFRVAPDGSGLVNLTPGAKLARDEPRVARSKPRVMVYSAREKSEAGTHVFVQGIDGGEPKQVYTEAQPGFVVGVSPDGSRALMLRQVSLSSTVAVQIDLDSGSAKRIYPPEGRTAHIADAQFSGDGKRVFVATDDGGESSFVVSVEVGSSNIVSGRYKEEAPATALIAELAPSPKDDDIAILVDAGNHSEVRLLDAHTLKLLGNVKTPLGSSSGLSFAGDGHAFAFASSTPDVPWEIVSADVTSPETKPLRTEKRPTLAGLAAIESSIDKVKAFDALSVPVNVYLPRARQGKLPAIVIVHGGPAMSFKVRWSPFVRFFTTEGYAVIEPNVRGSTGFGRAYEMADNREKRGDALKDLESVNAWVKAQSWCDPDKVVALGASYGGYMTLMGLTRQPTLWRAGVDLFGIYDLKTWTASTSGIIRSLLVDEFGALDKDAELLDAWSPKRDVDKVTAPLFVYAGANDPRVPRTESDAIVTALRARKIPVEYMVAADEGHSLARKATQVEFMTRVARFLDDQLKAPK